MSRIALVTLAGSLLLPSGALAQLPSYVLDDESVVRFECVGPDLLDAATGRFTAVSGNLQASPENLAGARGRVEVVLASITSDSSAWDAMFRSAPFLALDEHPRSRFELRRILGARSLTDGEWVTVRLVGRFSVHGVGRDMTIPGRMRWTSGERRVELNASFVLRWEQHRINVPTGNTRRFAGDAARVRVELVFRRRP